ncbi:MAG: hypothetical protein ABL308_12040 [Oceanicaulis sp.]
MRTHDLETELSGLARRLTGGADGRAVMVAPVSEGAGASTVAAALAHAACRETGRPTWIIDLDFSANTQASRAKLNCQAYAGELGGDRFWRVAPEGAGRLALRRCEDAPVFISEFQRKPGAVKRVTFHGSSAWWTRARQSCGLVLVDAPFGSAAAPALAADLDGVILVADARGSRRSEAERLTERIEEAGGRVLGVVVNRAPERR